MICLTRTEIESFYKDTSISEINAEINKSGCSLAELEENTQKKLKVVSNSTSHFKKDVHLLEIFASVFVFHKFYREDSFVCFDLKSNFNTTKNNVNSFGQLKDSIEECTITDFAILSGEKLRSFQFKRYRDKMITKNLLVFINNTLKKYGNNIGDVNLLIAMQPSGWCSISMIDFQEIHKELMKKNLSFTGHILISYNENNTFTVIKTVFPKLETTKNKINWRNLETAPKPYRV